MTDLLNREDVERIKEVMWPNIQKLCRDYLTLWDELKNERSISDRLMKRVAELEAELAEAQRIIHD